MARRKINEAEGEAALQRCADLIAAGQTPERSELLTAVRYSLEELHFRAPGKAVEVRVPPAAATQILGGTTHRRGTPPAVIETDPITWVRLATGQLQWDQARQSGTLTASGQRTDLTTLLPLVSHPVKAKESSSRGDGDE